MGDPAENGDLVQVALDKCVNSLLASHNGDPLAVI